MRSLILAAAIAGCASRPADTTRYISIDADAIETARTVAARHGARIEQVDGDANIAVIAIDAADLEPLSELMHQEHHRCGGFMLHESLEDAHAALLQPAFKDPIKYTLDRAALVQAVLPELDRTRILGTIRELSAMKNRYYRSDQGAAASLWLRDRWRSFSTRSDVTVELFDQGYPQQSVILTIPGSTRPDEIVVIGGHLDSIAPGGTSSTAPGADDDASGIATLTEVARVLLAKDYRPARTIKFMAYAAEEVGLRGSQAIVRAYKKRNINVVGALQLDMTNYKGSDKDIWLMKDFTDAAQNTFLTRLIDTYVGATWGLDVCGYACSDHAAWHRAGVPASMPFESASRDRNQKIHTPSDTLETSDRNAAHAVKFARLGAAYAIELAKGELASSTSIAQTPPASTCWWTLFGFAGLGLAGLGLTRWFARID